ncbi:hypothetical protein EPICR_130056 [Candidatus Desulfarcum epimagneticum]|uniref:Uncharacterized protein n=1 Tax=uncultured Desulfobacteraceae bacterium TaxID=218296 RepID=A0A484HFF9_9BACT|nr:hypothetical protein EPICR_130056 [uncultured Desulfobacteraceae bacterium]
MFSGRGSQRYHCLESFFRKNRTFGREMRRLDDVAAEGAGRSVLSCLYDGAKKKTDPFDCLTFSHPSLFMQQYALSRVMAEHLSMTDQQAVKTAELALKLEKESGFAVDIECGWKGEKLFLFQCRPGAA